MEQKDKNAAKKTVIITGANGNLGSAVTQQFLSAGYSVVATVIDEAAKKELPNHPELVAEIINLTDETAARDFVQRTIEQRKKIDAALLLVGGFAMGNLAATGLDDIKKQVALNFDTAYNMARPLYQHMLEQNRGRIVFIGARPAIKVTDGKNMIAYGLSKSLLFKLAEYINADAKGKNVTATVIVPSTLDTPQNRKSMPDADPEKWVKPASLAEILEFVVSERSTPLRETVLKVYNEA